MTGRCESLRRVRAYVATYQPPQPTSGAEITSDVDEAEKFQFPGYGCVLQSYSPPVLRIELSSAFFESTQLTLVSVSSV